MLYRGTKLPMIEEKASTKCSQNSNTPHARRMKRINFVNDGTSQGQKFERSTYLNTTLESSPYTHILCKQAAVGSRDTDDRYCGASSTLFLRIMEDVHWRKMAEGSVIAFGARKSKPFRSGKVMIGSYIPMILLVFFLGLDCLTCRYSVEHLDIEQDD